ncbi:MAG: acetoacetate--CoA ligase [Candidatus Marinimicrobia bacterium]|nr:acetoacetate--CoA ligase [Candidatus Neomarinimicrobiota bacterium]
MNDPLYTPTPDQITGSQMTAFREQVNARYGLALADYAQLYQWSIECIPDFWAAVWDFAEIVHSRSYTQVVDDVTRMPGARWFEGARLNFAENLLRHGLDRTGAGGGRVALRFRGEDQAQRSLTYAELTAEVRRLAQALREAGVQPGDRVAGFMPNLPETVVAMLAAAAIGAVWSSSSPDFGIPGVLDRFGQIEPKVLFAADGYFYNGKRHDSLGKLRGILSQLPAIEHVVVVSYTGRPELTDIPGAVHWDEFLPAEAPELAFEQLPFDHPLYIMYTSGTTGLPKSIVHSAGGTLIQHLKELRLHCDLRPDDTIFYFTTCGWMMWNWLVSSLAVGATVVLYDGSPVYPDTDALWRMADELGISVFGTSARYISAQEGAGERPAVAHDLSRLRAILSTGSPLSEESFDYVYSEVKPDLLLGSISGGTDILSCFALANPTLPVVRGRLQCRGLGMKVEAYDDSGSAVVGQKGELVCTRAFPSMPVKFWNDPDGSKYRQAYFAHYPGVWRHGDYISVYSDGSVKIFGRSDATLNPGGVRIGTAEIYRVVESLPGVADALAVGHMLNGEEQLLLFVKLAGDTVLSVELKQTIRDELRSRCSPRHVPASILAVPDIPYTINGKKVELAVKQILAGGEALNRDALGNPEALDHFRDLELPSG